MAIFNSYVKLPEGTWLLGIYNYDIQWDLYQMGFMGHNWES